MKGITGIRSQRGEIKFGSIVVMFVMAAAIYVGVKLYPSYYAYYKFKDAVQEMVKFASGRVVDVEDMRGRLAFTAKEWGLPIKPESIEVVWRPNRIDITVKWEDQVEMIGYTYRTTRVIKEGGPLFD